MTIRKILFPAIGATWTTKWSWFIALFTLTPLTIQNDWKMISDFVTAIRNPQEYFWLINSLKVEAFDFQDFLTTTLSAPLAMFILIISSLFFIILALFLAWIIINAQGIIILLHHPVRRHASTSLSKTLNRIGKLWVTLLELNIGLLIARLLSISLLLLLFSFIAGGINSLAGWLILIPILAGLAVLSLIIRFSIFKVLLEKKDRTSALKESFSHFKKHALSCLEFSFLLYLITLIIIVTSLYLLDKVVSPVELSETIILVLLLDAGIVPSIVILVMFFLMMLVTGWLALFNYTAWLTWYAETTDNDFTHSYLKIIYRYLRSYV